MAKILITGGTGLIGKELAHYFTNTGHTVVLLTRNSFKEKYPFKTYEWDVNSGHINEKAFEDIEHIIHLAGAGIADERWSKKRKQEIIDSRVKSTLLVAAYLKKLNIKPINFIGASAIGFYGAKTNEIVYKETDKGEIDFLSFSTNDWEESYDAIRKLGIETSVLRIGVVLSEKGGAYKKMAKPFKMGLGCALGSGKQYMPWIHVEDLIEIFNQVMLGKIKTGLYNAVASQHITNNEFSMALAKSLNKKLILPNVPAFILKLALGEMAIVLLEGSRVSNEKLLNTGFKFKYTSIEEALKSLA